MKIEYIMSEDQHQMSVDADGVGGGDVSELADSKNFAVIQNSTEEVEAATEEAATGEVANTVMVATEGVVATTANEDEDLDLSAHASFEIKPEGKSYKYPQLKRYFEFGPWVGRNRKAICIRCKHQSASSQPERLIKHMKRCTKLSDEDKALADGLLVENSLTRRKSNLRLSLGTDSEYYADDDLNNSELKPIKSPVISAKRLKKMDSNDRKTHIDQALTRFIMCCRIPLKSIHSKEFVEFVRALDPDYRLPSRETITNVLIPDMLHIS